MGPLLAWHLEISTVLHCHFQHRHGVTAAMLNPCRNFPTLNEALDHVTRTKNVLLVKIF